MTRARLLVTEECGRLARWLRLLGYDAAQQPAEPMDALFARAFNERRTIVTRHRSVRGGALCRVVVMREEALDAQLQRLSRELGLQLMSDRVLTRCDRCNAELDGLAKAAVHGRVPPFVYDTQERFFECPVCRRVYWAATHWQRIRSRLEMLAGQPGGAS